MYDRKYYLKNREKLLAYRKEWNKRHYKGLPEDNILRIRSLKAWRTIRRNNKNMKGGREE